MAKKKSSKINNSIEGLIGNIAARAINTVADQGLNKLSREAGKFFGVSGASIRDQIALDRSKLQLEKQQAETVRIKAVSAMEIEMFRIKLEDKEITIQEKRRMLEEAENEKAQLDLPEAGIVIDGALTIPQDRGGIVFPDEPEGYQEWLDSLSGGKVILVLGKRGSGKTALAARIAEFISATYGLAIYWVGLPAAARNLLPSWVKLVNDPGQVPSGSVVLADEAGLRYASLSFNSKDNKLLRAQLMIARHNYTSLIFAIQSSRDLEASIVRQADSVIFKRPGFNQPETERLNIRPMAREAAQIFQKIPKEKMEASAMVFDDLFSGVITTTVPSYWSDNLSHVYRHIDLNQLESRRDRAGELDQVVRGQTKLLEADSLDSQILKLRQEGHGIDKISKLLNCSQHRVRKCLSM